MLKNLAQLLDVACESFSQQKALVEGDLHLSFKEYKARASLMAFKIEEFGLFKQPVLVLLPKGIKALISFAGVLKSGNFYSIIDLATPAAKLEKILAKLKPALIIADKQSQQKYASVIANINCLCFDEMMKNKAQASDMPLKNQDKILDTDLAYVLFTSGSTGEPKGVAISHKSVLDYASWVVSKFELNQTDSLASQAPFYFDNSVLDIYASMLCGACLHILPTQLYAFPLRVLEYLRQNEINTIFWVPSVLVYFANTAAISKVELPKLKRVLFCGEIMPNAQLNIWRKTYPKALYANLYGPTEITDVCAYYIVNREFKDDELLPIGVACENTELLVFDESLKLISPDMQGVKGELAVRGSGLSVGYYGDLQKSEAAFIQNPLQNNYAEKIYLTGDIVAYNEHKELLCYGRKDSQIKLKGHRIELGEIEAAAGGISGVRRVACVFDSGVITLFYEAGSELNLKDSLKQKVNDYMLPARYFRVDSFALNQNGKIDRLKLLEILKAEL